MSKFDELPMNAVFRINGKDSTIYKKVDRGPGGNFIDIYFRDLGRFINPPTDTNMLWQIQKKLEKNGYQSVSRQEFGELREEFHHMKLIEDNVYLGEIR